ncbi:hypothetical protein EJ110_NYTH39032 [Nymphaea thermarum]|nr:hypothetical protein EJ110_NYTH39032 [Nymphaea thermarum]
MWMRKQSCWRATDVTGDVEQIAGPADNGRPYIWRREAHSRRADVTHIVGDPPSPFRFDLFHFHRRDPDPDPSPTGVRSPTPLPLRLPLVFPFVAFSVTDDPTVEAAAATAMVEAAAVTAAALGPRVEAIGDKRPVGCGYMFGRRPLLVLPLVSPVGAQAVQGPRVLVCCAWSVGSRLPNLGVLGKAECLTLDFTQSRMSALPLQRMKWIHTVEEELLNLQQGDQSLAQYFASLKSISERLKALRPPCPTCYKTHGEQSMVAKFLQGLSSEYAVAKAQMLTGAEIPDLAEAYNRLSHLVVILSSPASDIHASALAASGGRGRGLFRGRDMGRGSGGGRGRFQCTYCGKIVKIEDGGWSGGGDDGGGSVMRGQWDVAMCLGEVLLLPLVSPVRSAGGARPQGTLCVVLGALGSRLPNLGVLGKAEYLSLEFIHPGLSALPLQRMKWIYTVMGHHRGCLSAVLADPGQQVDQMASLTSYWGGFGFLVVSARHGLVI